MVTYRRDLINIDNLRPVPVPCMTAGTSSAAQSCPVYLKTTGGLEHLANTTC